MCIAWTTFSRSWLARAPLCGSRLGPLGPHPFFGSSGGGFGLSARCLLGSERFHPRGFDASRFRGGSLLSSRSFGGSLGRGRRGRSLLFGSGLNIGGFATAANRRVGRRRRCGGLGDGYRRASAASCRRRRRSLLGTNALLALPSRADAGDLVVAEHAHVAANGHVHLSKKCDHFFGRDPELIRQLTD